MKQGMRKFWLAVFYLIAGTGLAVLLICKQPIPDLVGLAAFITGLAGGMFTFVWGNAKEHQAQAVVKAGEVKHE